MGKADQQLDSAGLVGIGWLPSRYEVVGTIYMETDDSLSRTRKSASSHSNFTLHFFKGHTVADTSESSESTRSSDQQLWSGHPSQTS